MPKMKSRKSAVKRFRRTGSGKLLRRGGNRQHKSEHRPTKEMRRRKGDVEVAAADRPRVERMLGS